MASQGVKGTFSYLPPQILEITPISAAGGKVDIVGLNFGRNASSISVQVEGVNCNKSILLYRTRKFLVLCHVAQRQVKL